MKMKISLGLAIAAACAVKAQYLVESSSFGHGDSISPNKYAVKGWHVSGEGHVPQLMTDKIILTPPYPGNKRGALWAESRVSQSEWTADFEFRASGPERGGGNLQIWYTKEGRDQISTSSIYTIGKFDGLVLVVDTYGGKGGTVRGFLNDGSADYKNHHAVDSLAFGHCDYAYRNLGRPSQIQIKQEANGFEVKVDQRSCFSSDKIKLPSENHFGITAASADIPDSFEAYKFILTTSSSFAREEPRRDDSPPQPIIQQPSGGTVDDVSALSITSQDAQFADLHNRIQMMGHSVDNLFRELANFAGKSEERHREITQGYMSGDKLNALDQRLQAMERSINTIQQKVDSRDYQQHFNKLHDTLRDSHSTLLERVPRSVNDGTSIGFK
ncbi:hypothetical protein MMC20_000134 [Loxospora ochrophaea]|nr:hypothetical protein [Loxospora ochrophaea]